MAGEGAVARNGSRAARVGEGRLVYAVGDVHGRADLLARLLASIRADAASRPEPRRLLVFLGDYVDRGPDSRRVLDLLTAPPGDGFERVHLKGNHEDAMLRFLEDARAGRWWIGPDMGGAATLASYGVDAGQPAARVHGELCRRLPGAHRAFLENLALCHEEGDYLFVHAGIRPGVALASQTAEDMMWIRHEFLDWPGALPRTVVHGHSIHPRPAVRRHRIGIDTGAWHFGTLTCLALAGDSRRFLQAR